jgi:short-subunit dehydrogenase involved in D-alanine esterification of teichoic acids
MTGPRPLDQGLNEGQEDTRVDKLSKYDDEGLQNVLVSSQLDKVGRQAYPFNQGSKAALHSMTLSHRNRQRQGPSKTIPQMTRAFVDL